MEVLDLVSFLVDDSDAGFVLCLGPSVCSKVLVECDVEELNVGLVSPLDWAWLLPTDGVVLVLLLFAVDFVPLTTRSISAE